MALKIKTREEAVAVFRDMVQRKKAWEAAAQEDWQTQEGMVAEPSPAIAYAKRNPRQSSKLLDDNEVVRGQINSVLEANAEFDRTGVAYSLEEVIARSHQRHPWLR